MRIYMIRHGETDMNVKRLLQGRSNSALNENGVFLTEITAEAMKDIPFTVCFSSPLKRAMDTAKILLRGRPVEIIPEPALTEIDFGILEGKSLHPDHPEIERPSCLRMKGDPFEYVPPEGGESVQEVVERGRVFFQKLVTDRDRQDDEILLSTHGLASRAFLYAVCGGEDFWHGMVPPNCAVTIFEAHDGKIRLEELDKIYYPAQYLQDYYAELRTKTEQHENH